MKPTKEKLIPVKFYMAEKSKPNYWIHATILLGILLLSVIAWDIYQKQTTTYDFGTLKISQADFNKLTDSMNKTGQKAKICDITNKNCIIVTKIK